MIESLTHWQGVPVVSQGDMRGEPDAPEALIMTRKVDRIRGVAYHDYAVYHVQRSSSGELRVLRRLATSGGGPGTVVETYAAWLTERLTKLDQVN